MIRSGRAIAAAALLAGSLVACAFPSAPPVQCLGIDWANCQRAVLIARRIAPDYWWGAESILVHLGACTRSMFCPPEVATTPSFITVELLIPGSDEPFVRIDRTSNWDAQCLVLVREGNAAHTAPC